MRSVQTNGGLFGRAIAPGISVLQNAHTAPGGEDFRASFLQESKGVEGDGNNQSRTTAAFDARALQYPDRSAVTVESQISLGTKPVLQGNVSREESADNDSAHATKSSGDPPIVVNAAKADGNKKLERSAWPAQKKPNANKMANRAAAGLVPSIPSNAAAAAPEVSISTKAVQVSAVKTNEQQQDSCVAPRASGHSFIAEKFKGKIQSARIDVSSRERAQDEKKAQTAQEVLQGSPASGVTAKDHDTGENLPAPIASPVASHHNHLPIVDPANDTAVVTSQLPISTNAAKAATSGNQTGYNVTAGVETPQVLIATPSKLDVGVFNETHGWVQVRAELGSARTVNASVTVMGTAHEGMRVAMPAIVSYLGGESVKVDRLTVHRFIDDGMNVAVSADGRNGEGAHGNTNREASDQPNETGAPGKNSGGTQHIDELNEPDARVPAAMKYDGGVTDQRGKVSGSFVSGDYGIGAWLNVSA